MKSIITSKYQVTIPKSIRQRLKLSVKDIVEWKIEDGKLVIYPLQISFLDHKNSIKTGAGDTRKDIQVARERITENFS